MHRASGQSTCAVNSTSQGGSCGATKTPQEGRPPWTELRQPARLRSGPMAFRVRAASPRGGRENLSQNCNGCLPLLLPQPPPYHPTFVLEDKTSINQDHYLIPTHNLPAHPLVSIPHVAAVVVVVLRVAVVFLFLFCLMETTGVSTQEATKFKGAAMRVVWMAGGIAVPAQCSSACNTGAEPGEALSVSANAVSVLGWRSGTRWKLRQVSTCPPWVSSSHVFEDPVAAWTQRVELELQEKCCAQVKVGQ